MDFWYSFSKSIVRFYVNLFIDVHLQGKEHIQPGPKIIVANHPNATDGFVLPFIFPDKLHYLIEGDIFTLPVIGKLLKLADQIPVIIGRGREALNDAREWLTKGDAVVIFPEGRLSDAESVRRAGAGAALLALQTGAPVLPIGFYVPSEFTRNMQAPLFHRTTSGRWQFGGKCFIQVGQPWQTAAAQSVEKNYRLLRKWTDDMMLHVTDLMQQAKREAESYLYNYRTFNGS